ncbi:MAG: type I restriction endonuclease subunit R [Lentisphaeria bacterium]|nr:type I restriction endonuclease subunit R [Lentisphaeria bacterium]
MEYTEANYENAVIQLIEQLGYTHVYGPDVERDHHDPLYAEELDRALVAINPSLPRAAVDEALFKLRNIENGSLVQKNLTFTDYLQNGIEVTFTHEGEQKHDRVRLIDYEYPERNSFTVANQWTFIEHSEKRADVVIFVNGLPLVVIELKSPSREETDASEAYRQLKNYMQEIPSFFIFNAFCVMSDMAETRVGTITSGEDRFMQWKTVDGSYESTAFADFHVLFEGMLEKRRFPDILRNFICFSRDNGKDAKILAGYHQYYAVRKAIDSAVRAADPAGDGRGGVFWHTQGSGKSLSMVFFAHLLQSALNSPTIVVLTDRNDLDDQLYGQFAKCQDFLRQVPHQASSCKNLKELLAGREANGIIFTTMQKFEEADSALSERHNIVVMADEAHRGQYGFEKINVDGKVHIGTARLIRDALPNATFIGFTGTPIAMKDRNTREVFGDYIDIYDMTQAVEDGATRPVFYESRVVHLNLDEKILKKIDAEYDLLAEHAEPYAIEKSKKELGQMESILGAPQTIDALCKDIVEHYENFRAQELTGKAMIVAYSRPIAMSIYRRILKMRPAWNEKVAVVMTDGNDDPEDWRPVIGNKAKREQLAVKFKDNDDPLKIAIVVDMWLTGFDMPSLATMYVYKPMSGHNLMQTIARVTRVFKDKEGGLVVDYVGIASALKQAMKDYTSRDRKNYGDTDIGKAALPKFQEKLEVCRALLHGFDYSRFMEGGDLERSQLIVGGVNFLSDPGEPKKKDLFIKEGLLLRQALSLCRSIVPQSERYEAALFEAVRTMLTRITGNPKHFSLKEINERINELLKQSIKSEGVINLFADVKEEFSLFDPKFLEEISKMKEKNVAIEILKKLIAEQVSVYRHTNVVKSELFSERLQRAMNAYLNGMLTNEEVIEELKKMAKDIAAASAAGNQLGLSAEEMAFYDALTKPEAVKDFYDNDQLVAITRELTEMLRANKTVDWQKKETARARMRSMVKRLLKRYKYPPEGQAEALETVIRQCEMWTDNLDIQADDPGEAGR